MNVVVGSLKDSGQFYTWNVSAEFNSLQTLETACSLKAVLKHLIFTNIYGPQVFYMVSTGDWDTDQVSSLVAS